MAAAKSSSKPVLTTNKEYAPSQIRIDQETGEKWRLCAGAAVLNSKNQLLIGERLFGDKSFSNAWQCPQGGVDDTWTPKESDGIERPKETIMEACHRELFEEMGLRQSKHVIVDEDMTPNHNDTGIRYRTQGSSNWLTKAGFAGQEIHWTIYRCVDALGDQDPSFMCDLSGHGGEDAEFSAVKWQDIDDVVEHIWEAKRQPYEFLKDIIVDKTKNKWDETIKSSSLDLSGRWNRVNSQCSGVPEALVQRGLSMDEATKEASKPYIQHWARISEDPTGYVVTTYDVDGATVRRELEYRVGEWTEDYKGNAVIFGPSSTGDDAGNSSKPTTLRRRTTYVAEPDAKPISIAHVTVTNGPKGIEESRRYIREGKMVLRRTLWPNTNGDHDDDDDDDTKPVICTEIFSRVQ